MSKIRTRICDVCGHGIYQHAHNIYTIKKRLWEVDKFSRRIDLCENCYYEMENWIFENVNRGKEKNNETN